jgi:hypothetical protein
LVHKRKNNTLCNKGQKRGKWAKLRQNRAKKAAKATSTTRSSRV